MTEKKIRLTAYTACAGCAAKTAAGDLLEVLAVLESRGPAAAADLLVGLEKPDDAAVYRIAPDRAIVGTVDFFPPVVDDPYTWGAVAAANAMSDVYAMGALLFESETSGGLLFSVAADRAPEVVPRFARHGARCWEIGIVAAAPTITVTP